MKASVYIHISDNDELISRETIGSLFVSTEKRDVGVFVQSPETADNLVQILRAWIQDREMEDEVSVDEAIERR